MNFCAKVQKKCICTRKVYFCCHRLHFFTVASRVGCPRSTKKCRYANFLVESLEFRGEKTIRGVFAPLIIYLITISRISYLRDLASASYAANGKIKHAVPSIVGSLVE